MNSGLLFLFTLGSTSSFDERFERIQFTLKPGNPSSSAIISKELHEISDFAMLARDAGGRGR